MGYDVLSEKMQGLKLGVIDFIIDQNPKRHAYLGLDFLIECFLFDKKIPKKMFLPRDIINSENVSTYLDI